MGGSKEKVVTKESKEKAAKVTAVVDKAKDHSKKKKKKGKDKDKDKKKHKHESSSVSILIHGSSMGSLCSTVAIFPE